MSSTADPAFDDPFIVHRGLLFTVAYEILGTAADAEDVLQESWLRWTGVDQSTVREPRAYLVRIVTRQSLNHLRAVSRRREDYVGPWLPEPLMTSPDVADDVVLAESVSLAMLTVLETLTPVERAVFVLREVFDVPFDEIADAVDKTSAAVRQIAHRARDHVAARRPRMEVDASEHDRVVRRFVAALDSGDMQALMDVLAPDVVSVTDSGGLVRGAARVPLVGAERVVAFLRGSIAKLDVDYRVQPIVANGRLAARIEVGGALMAVVSFTVADGRISRVFSTANPQKLEALGTEHPLVR
ncbi:RNA polymerase sigma-70 factor (TIGR02957 family) [Microbacterium sp. W4I4]|uniref:RNA polymerase sigma-70 factor n=1 Tax=Microbacterium sp. W4I4 TaxID=3042295 RepID=UPI00278918B8|nr:RNA polymerase sigma-70 factor [Microbacterium sp. W4I4]MDQ0614956.1 RNA polymerase sigma-70 factor (TIGR02957 family) [Microbacterium sp. W4I4]